jgi:prepilin-type N-terminal cleavage/methylation domain-containing protein
MYKSTDYGFSLVEVLIILSIISIAAAIVIPGIMISRQAANEAGAIQGCRLLASAELAYASRHNQEYADLTTLIDEELLDPKYGTEDPVSGYRFVMGNVEGTNLDGIPPESFGFIATPERGSGWFVYAVAPDGIVRYQDTLGGYPLPEGFSAGDPVEKPEEEDPQTQ